MDLEVIIIMCIQKKLTLSSNDDKRLQTYDRITAYPYEYKCF